VGTAKSWNTIPVDRSYGGASVTSTPPIETVPAVGRSKPAIVRRVVVFPQPEGPTSVTNSPRSISRSTSSTASTPPGYRFVMPDSAMSLIG